MKTYHFSRSMLETFDSCPYQGFLQYFHPGPQGARLGEPGSPPAGVTYRTKGVSLATGGAVHKGFEALLLGSSEDSSAGLAVEYIERLVRDGRGLEEDHGGSADPFVVKEACAMSEALVRLANRVLIKDLLQEYKVLATERELTRELDAFSIFSSRADAVLESRSTGAQGLLSIKTTKYLSEDSENGGSSTGAKIEEQANIDMQGVSEMWTAAKEFPSVSFVQMLYLKKGKRDKYKKRNFDGERWFHHTPLLTGWKSVSGDPGKLFQYAHAWEGRRDDGSLTKLSYNWERLWCFEEFAAPGDEYGVKTWMAMLEGKETWPGYLGGANKPWHSGMVKIPYPINRTLVDEELFFAKAQRMAFELVNNYNNLVPVDGLINYTDSNKAKLEMFQEGFYQNRRSCLWPARCSYFKHCHEGMPIIDHGLLPEERVFVPRVPNHPEEEV